MKKFYLFRHDLAFTTSSKRPPAGAARTAPLAAAILVLMALAIWSAAWGVADVLAIKPRYLIFSWQRGGSAGSVHDWEEALSGLTAAARLDPFSADYPADIGRLYEWAALGEPVWTDRAKSLRSEAITYYEQALRRSPARGFVWAHLAQSRFLNRDTAEGATALELAMTLGPWEPQTRRKAIWVGFAAWGALPANLKDLVRENVERELSRGGAEFVMRSAIKLGRQDALWPMLAGEAHRGKFSKMLRAVKENQG